MRTDLSKDELRFLDALKDCANGHCHPPFPYSIMERSIATHPHLPNFLADGIVQKRPTENDPKFVYIYPTDDGLFLLRLHGMI